MYESSIPRPLRRWGERVILTAMVLAGFGIGTAGLALIGERWQDDPVVLEDPVVLDDPAPPPPAEPDQPVVELAFDAEPVPELEAERDRRHDEHGRRRGARRR